MDSLLHSYDLAIRAILYDRFATILGIDLQSSSEDADINLSPENLEKDTILNLLVNK